MRRVSRRVTVRGGKSLYPRSPWDTIYDTTPPISDVTYFAGPVCRPTRDPSVVSGPPPLPLIRLWTVSSSLTPPFPASTLSVLLRPDPLTVDGSGVRPLSESRSSFRVVRSTEFPSPYSFGSPSTPVSTVPPVPDSALICRPRTGSGGAGGSGGSAPRRSPS